MDLLAVPSVCFETGPLVVLEGFAAGLPVVGSDIGGIAERVRHGESGWLVPVGNVDAWARALTLLHDRWLAADWCWGLPATRAAIEVATETEAIYKELLQSCPVPLRREANN
jgi:glycosyltransferase involved in cell wall biosynthesis